MSGLFLEPRSTGQPELQDRLEYELGVITSMGYPGYFLVVADFIRFAREDGIQTSCRGRRSTQILTRCRRSVSRTPTG